MKFSEVNIGEQFFDPVSGEYFEKANNSTAVYISGGDFFELLEAAFSADDTVEL
jgi:hypothetical protein